MAMTTERSPRCNPFVDPHCDRENFPHLDDAFGELNSSGGGSSHGSTPGRSSNMFSPSRGVLTAGADGNTSIDTLAHLCPASIDHSPSKLATPISQKQRKVNTSGEEDDHWDKFFDNRPAVSLLRTPQTERRKLPVLPRLYDPNTDECFDAPAEVSGEHSNSGSSESSEEMCMATMFQKMNEQCPNDFVDESCASDKDPADTAVHVAPPAGDGDFTELSDIHAPDSFDMDISGHISPILSDDLEANKENVQEMPMDDLNLSPIHSPIARTDAEVGTPPQQRGSILSPPSALRKPASARAATPKSVTFRDPLAISESSGSLSQTTDSVSKCGVRRDLSRIFDDTAPSHKDEGETMCVSCPSCGHHFASPKASKAGSALHGLLSTSNESSWTLYSLERSDTMAKAVQRPADSSRRRSLVLSNGDILPLGLDDVTADNVSLPSAELQSAPVFATALTPSVAEKDSLCSSIRCLNSLNESTRARLADWNTANASTTLLHRSPSPLLSDIYHSHARSFVQKLRTGPSPSMGASRHAATTRHGGTVLQFR